MGILDFIIKRKEEKRDMKRSKKKKIASRAAVSEKKQKQKQKKKKLTAKVVVKMRAAPRAIKKEEKKIVKESPLWSYSEAKEALLKLKEEILNTVSLRDTSEGTLQREELIDEVDHTIEERQKELTLLLNEREKAKLSEIDEALLRIENRTYGICEECGERISPERLKFIPYVRYCVDCQDKIEKEKEEEMGAAGESSRVVLPPGFSDTNENEEI